MHSKEEEKTSFIVKEGTFFYTCMLFGLKNAGAMYQPLMNRMFKGQLCKRTLKYKWMAWWKKLENIEEHISNLVDTFDILRQYNKKLNTNGVFEVTFEKFFRVSGVC